MAKEVVRLCNEEDNSDFSYSYDLDAKIEDKIEAIVKKVYGGNGVDFTPNAQKQLQALYKNGFDKLPVCVAKLKKVEE